MVNHHCWTYFSHRTWKTPFLVATRKGVALKRGALRGWIVPSHVDPRWIWETNNQLVGKPLSFGLEVVETIRSLMVFVETIRRSGLESPLSFGSAQIRQDLLLQPSPTFWSPLLSERIPVRTERSIHAKENIPTVSHVVFQSRARTLLGAPGRTTRNKKLLGAPGLTTWNKKLRTGLLALLLGTRSYERGSWPYYLEQEATNGAPGLTTWGNVRY